MPEGDTLHRTAAALHRALAGQTIVRCESQLVAVDRAGLAGHAVGEVVALGKNVLIRFDDGRALHSHMRMNGSWHIYRPGARWQRSARAARVVLATETVVAVCFDAPVIRLIAAGAEPRDPHVAGLGPDLLASDFDAAATERAVRNLRAAAALEIGDAVMQQRLLAGIGNVYKSETLFLVRVNPFARVAALDDGVLGRIVEEARRLLVHNTMHGGPRTTRSSIAGSRSWVYLRSGSPCFVCGETIAMKRQGVTHRSTYFCPRCQAS